MLCSGKKVSIGQEEMSSSCSRECLDWILGNTYALTGLPSTGLNCPGKWLSHHLWKYLKHVLLRDKVLWWMWQCWVGFDDLEVLFQQFYDSMIPHFKSRMSCWVAQKACAASRYAAWVSRALLASLLGTFRLDSVNYFTHFFWYLRNSREWD